MVPQVQAFHQLSFKEILVEEWKERVDMLEIVINQMVQKITFRKDEWAISWIMVSEKLRRFPLCEYGVISYNLTGSKESLTGNVVHISGRRFL
jgi:hypothetical protein